MKKTAKKSAAGKTRGQVKKNTVPSAAAEKLGGEGEEGDAE